MCTCNISTMQTKRDFTSMFCLLLIIILFPVTGHAQKNPYFSKDSIPVVDGKVVFSIDFDYDLDKRDFMRLSVAYLSGKMEPYEGAFIASNRDSTVCRITDYLEIESNPAQVFAVYVTYNLRLDYENGKCKLAIHDFSYMEKTYFETQEISDRKLDMPEYTGEEMMVEKSYTRLLTKNPSGKITEATIKRINEIIDNLELSFARIQ